jgi:hypothetical protein
MTGGFSYTMHAYGSSRAYVDNYLVVGNVCYDAGPFLIGGGRPSRNIRVLENYLHGVNMRIGYSAPDNEDCEIRDNVIVGGRLEIKNYRKVVKEDNVVLGPGEELPMVDEHWRDASAARPRVRVNRYDPNRANVVIFNLANSVAVELPAGSFLEAGDEYRLLDTRGFFGRPVLSGRFDGSPLRVPVEDEFAAFVLVKRAGR